VLLLMTVALVAAAAVSLVVGFVQGSVTPVYVSIGTSVLALVILVAYGRIAQAHAARVVRLPRPPPVEADTGVLPAVSPTKARSASRAFVQRPRTLVVSPDQEAPFEAGDHEVTDEDDRYEPVFEELPIPGYDQLKVADILPLLVNLDTADLAAVRAAEEAGKARTTVLSRIDSLSAPKATRAPRSTRHASSNGSTPSRPSAPKSGPTPQPEP
jgi:hypothetical protein